MQNWNVPLNIVRIVKEIMLRYNLLDKTGLRYDLWLETLKNKQFSSDDKIILNYLKEGFSIINDPKLDYHMLSLEGQLKVRDDENLTLQEKYLQLVSSSLMNDIRKMYSVDLNKMKTLFLECIKNTAHLQSDHFLVMKYNKNVTLLDLWNDFYMETRGVVIDLENLELVTVAYPKFFNLNEKPFTQLNVVLEKMVHAKRVFIRNKEDGSMVAVSKYKNQIFTSTPGSLESTQAIWTKQFLAQNYASFIEDIPESISFIFEAIYPDNRIVLDYKGREMLVLTGIRDIKTGKLFSQTLVEDYARKYGFPTPQLETKSFEQILVDSTDNTIYPGTEKEGWVVICENEDETFMFKLKCDEYCQIHRLVEDATNVRILLPLLQNDTFDDFFSKIPAYLQPKVKNIVDKIQMFVQSKLTNINNCYQSIPSDVLITKEEFDKQEAFKIAVDNIINTYGDPKMSKNSLSVIRQNLISLSVGKSTTGDKWVQKETERLWELIPSELKEQKTFQQKNGKMLGFINKNIPAEYRPYVLKMIKFEPFDLLQELSYRDVRHLETNPNE